MCCEHPPRKHGGGAQWEMAYAGIFLPYCGYVSLVDKYVFQTHRFHLVQNSTIKHIQKSQILSCSVHLLGSYDHTVKMFDTRTEKSIMTMEHGHPVESVNLFPSGGLLVTAGIVK